MFPSILEVIGFMESLKLAEILLIQVGNLMLSMKMKKIILGNKQLMGDDL